MKELIRKNYVDVIFYAISFIAIGVFVGINTAIFLIFFLLLFALFSYSAIGIYNTLRGVTDKWLLWKMASTITVGAIVYFQYGFDILLKTVSYALAITVIMVLFVIFYLNRKK